jgi:hypothetical protein
MTESRAENFCQNVKHGCRYCMSVRSLGNPSNRGKLHLLEYALNSNLNTEIVGPASPSCDVDIRPAPEELPAPMSRFRVREGIIAVYFDRLEMYLPALQAVPLANLDEETLFRMTVT